ncbi:hypothetical protein chiPu_0007800 [Chiloscyllium punctatum]|uniref:Uncharacterized protein n=1 Tax=Chiloscyllium punctatum TaxID=137246 RepID=A0A401SG25_CHIPU|nr:hypothetical protein [Chiloscyllium punctatum]
MEQGKCGPCTGNESWARARNREQSESQAGSWSGEQNKSRAEFQSTEHSQHGQHSGTGSTESVGRVLEPIKIPAALKLIELNKTNKHSPRLVTGNRAFERTMWLL